jgi:hypothetical protein
MLARATRMHEAQRDTALLGAAFFGTGGSLWRVVRIISGDDAGITGPVTVETLEDEITGYLYTVRQTVVNPTGAPAYVPLERVEFVTQAAAAIDVGDLLVSVATEAAYQVMATEIRNLHTVAIVEAQT